MKRESLSHKVVLVSNETSAHESTDTEEFLPLAASPSRWADTRAKGRECTLHSA